LPAASSFTRAWNVTFVAVIEPPPRWPAKTWGDSVLLTVAPEAEIPADAEMPRPSAMAKACATACTSRSPPALTWAPWPR
jgi:hypothetical protein